MPESGAEPAALPRSHPATEQLSGPQSLFRGREGLQFRTGAKGLGRVIACRGTAHHADGHDANRREARLERLTVLQARRVGRGRRGVGVERREGLPRAARLGLYLNLGFPRAALRIEPAPVVEGMPVREAYAVDQNPLRAGNGEPVRLRALAVVG